MFIKNKTTTKIILLFLVFTLFLTVVEAQTPLRIYKFENLGECVHIAGPESGSSERLIFVIVGEELTNERSKADALVTLIVSKQPFGYLHYEKEKFTFLLAESAQANLPLMQQDRITGIYRPIDHTTISSYANQVCGGGKVIFINANWPNNIQRVGYSYLGGNVFARDDVGTILHELGHSVCSLGDEYAANRGEGSNNDDSRINLDIRRCISWENYDVPIEDCFAMYFRRKDGEIAFQIYRASTSKSIMRSPRLADKFNILSCIGCLNELDTALPMPEKIEKCQDWSCDGSLVKQPSLDCSTECPIDREEYGCVIQGDCTGEIIQDKTCEEETNVCCLTEPDCEEEGYECVIENDCTDSSEIVPDKTCSSNTDVCCSTEPDEEEESLSCEELGEARDDTYECRFWSCGDDAVSVEEGECGFMSECCDTTLIDEQNQCAQDPEEGHHYRCMNEASCTIVLRPTTQGTQQGIVVPEYDNICREDNLECCDVGEVERCGDLSFMRQCVPDSQCAQAGAEKEECGTNELCCASDLVRVTLVPSTPGPGGGGGTPPGGGSTCDNTCRSSCSGDWSPRSGSCPGGQVCCEPD